MSGLLVVAGRELKARWTVLVAALVAGILAIALPMVSSLGRRNARDAREVAAVVFAVALAFGIAAIVGAGMINRDLVERRHGFLFARPLSAAAIWCGKVLACWLLAMGAGLIVLLPAVALTGGLRPFGATAFYWDNAAGLGAVAAAVLLLILLAHAIALMVRSHTPWLLAIDAILGIGVIVLAGLALRSLVVADASDAAIRGAVGFTVVVFVAMFAAGWAQVALGRTDIRRGHKVLSLTVWSTVGGAALLFAGYARWVQSVDVSGLAYLGDVVFAPKGDWAFIEGRAWGRGDYFPAFLLDTRSGRGVRLPSAHAWWLGGHFADDGTRVVWMSSPASFSDSGRDVVTLDLTDPAAAPITTRIGFSRGGTTVLGLSPDGRRIVVRDEGTVSVMELLTGRLLASVRLPEGVASGSVKLLWPAPDTLSLAGRAPLVGSADEGDVRLFEIDLSRRTLSETGRITGVGRPGVWGILFDPKTGNLVTKTGPRSGNSIVLCNGRTGARVATLATCASFRGCRATMLSDGTIAVGEAGDAGVYLRLFSTTVALQQTIRVGSGRALFFGAQPTPRTLVIATRPQAERSPTETRADLKSYVVDVVSGTVTTLGAGYSPRNLAGWPGSSTVPTPGSAATRAFIDLGGHLVMLDPETNTFRTVLSVRWYEN